MQDLGEQIRKMVEGLVNLEVNTIIKYNMTGRKMPLPRHALIDIAQQYFFKLGQLGYNISLDEDEGKVKLGGLDSFNIIREKAKVAIKDIQAKRKVKTISPQEEVDAILLFRIKRMSDQVKELFVSLKNRGVKEWDNNYGREEVEKHSPLPLTANELVLIRKIWEMGLEEIALQTIIQLDGDVITRIQPKYANEENSALHLIHNQSVDVSLRFWSELVGIVKTIFTTIMNPLK